MGAFIVPLSATYIAYLSTNRLVNLVLTKTVFQLFFLQLHTLRMQSTGDMFFQIRFSNLSGALLHNETVKGHVILYLVSQGYKGCSKYDFSVVIGMSRKFEESKSFLYQTSYEYIKHDIFEQ